MILQDFPKCGAIATIEELQRTKDKYYASGDLIKVGDIVYWGWLMENTDADPKYRTCSLIRFKKEELNKIYDFLVGESYHKTLPRLIRK